MSWIDSINVRDIMITTDKSEQIFGSDLSAKNIIFQVKCDIKGGHKEGGGSGNLFIQTAERNNTGEI